MGVILVNSSIGRRLNFRRYYLEIGIHWIIGIGDVIIEMGFENIISKLHSTAKPAQVRYIKKSATL